MYFAVCIVLYASETIAAGIRRYICICIYIYIDINYDCFPLIHSVWAGASILIYFSSVHQSCNFASAHSIVNLL